MEADLTPLRDPPARPWSSRLTHFQEFTIAHPRLVEAKERLMEVIDDASPNSIVLVLGPTGVGKTTLAAKVEQLLTQAVLPELETDRGRLPVVSVEAVAPESGSFVWRDLFKRMLVQMDEPLVDRKQRREPRGADEGGDHHANFLPLHGAVGSEYQFAVEQALRYRRPAAVLIDEAQHLAKVPSGRRILDQLDVIKSLANRARTVHVLVGTYDLLAFRNLSGQLSRRSIDVHFPRYQAENVEDRAVFLNILRSFEQQIPLPEPADLTSDWEYLYERSTGCVGVLKEWLVKAISAALRRNDRALTRRHLEDNALSISQCEKMLAEIIEGETRLAESDEARSRLRMRLGLGSSGTKIPHVKSPPDARVARRARPGERRPRRDRVGISTNVYAGSTV